MRVLVLFILIASFSFSQKTYVPDDNFEFLLEQNGMGDGVMDNDSVLTANINTVDSLNVNGDFFGGPQAIYFYDLTGIEDFDSLTYLSCESNFLMSLDVSNNTALEILYCGANQLSSLDVSNNTALTYFDCGGNQLSSLDVSNHTSLSILFCGGNQLSSLDVSNNTALEILYCGANQLSSLDVSNNTALEILSCGSNQLSSLDLSNSLNLSHLYVENNQLTSLDINTYLTYLFCENNQLTSLDFNNVYWLDCSFNQLSSLDLSNCTSLHMFDCRNNQLSSLDLSNTINNLEQFFCMNNQLTCLNLKNGNNTWLLGFSAINNPNLSCIQVDDFTYSIDHWASIDPQTCFSENCNYSSGCFLADIDQVFIDDTPVLIKITDMMGQESKPISGQPFLYIYDNGTVEKKMIVE